MSAIITGLGSGFDIETIVSQLVSVKQSSTVEPLQTKLAELEDRNSAIASLKGKYTTLQTALQNFTNTIYDSSSDMWTNTTIKSSNDAYASATSSGTVAASSIELKVEQVATATVAKSAHSLGLISKENAANAKFTTLANGQAKSGNFSLFLNGKEYDIDIKENFTLNDVINEIDKVTSGKVKASISDDGIFSISAADKNSTLTLGATDDESNIISALKLKEDSGASFSSAYPVSTVNTSESILSEKSGLFGLEFFDSEGNPATSGKIYINGEEFEVNEKTTINSLISKINGNSDANVKASYDSLTNRISLTSTETGKTNISLSSDGTNLLNVLGLTTGVGDDEVIALGSQTLGQNAIAYINGNKVISASNTITGESSGITNLSITIKKPTSEYSGNSDDESSIKLDIEPDYTKVKESLTKFVDSYNDVVETTREMTSSDGEIGYDSSLNAIISKIKQITSTVSKNEGDYTMLAQIGINTSSTSATNLSIDNEKLDKALKENFESVKYLLSDGLTEENDTGIFDSVLKNVNSALDVDSGYFNNTTESIDSQIKSMNDRIERANTRLVSYQNLLYKQFNTMDSTISALQSQLSTFQSYIG